MASKSSKAPAGRKGQGPQRKSGGQNRLLVLGIGGVVVAIAVAVLIVLSQRSDGAGTAADAGDVATGSVAGVAEIEQLLDGIPQDGMVLGFPEAPVTLREYGDLRCPSCKAWDDTTAPTVIEQLVRTKKAKLELKLWPITGDAEGTTNDAINAARGGLAAAEQDRLWHFALLFWKNQPDEQTTYATPGFLRSIAAAAKVPDLDAFEAARADASTEAVLQQNGVQAGQLGFRGTPSFAVVTAAGETPLKADQGDVAAIGAELEAAAAAG